MNVITSPAAPPAPARADRCGERTRLPGHLVAEALALAPGTDETPLTDLRCTFQQHGPDDDHCGFVLHVGLDLGSVCATWFTGSDPDEVLVLPDCDAVREGDGEPCRASGRHPGDHTYDRPEPSADQLIRYPTGFTPTDTADAIDAYIAALPTRQNPLPTHTPEPAGPGTNGKGRAQPPPLSTEIPEGSRCSVAGGSAGNGSPLSAD